MSRARHAPPGAARSFEGQPKITDTDPGTSPGTRPIKASQIICPSFVREVRRHEARPAASGRLSPTCRDARTCVDVNMASEIASRSPTLVRPDPTRPDSAAGGWPQATGSGNSAPPSIATSWSDAGWSSSVARWAHNPEVAGSNPAPATRKLQVRGLIARTAVGPLDHLLAIRWRDKDPDCREPQPAPSTAGLKVSWQVSGVRRDACPQLANQTGGRHGAAAPRLTSRSCRLRSRSRSRFRRR